LNQKAKTMKTKYLFLAIAALLAAGGLWLARGAWRTRTHAFHKSSMGVSVKMPRGPNFDPNSPASLPGASQTGAAPDPDNQPKPGQMLHTPARLAPPDPNRKFWELTPEQRVLLARQGPIGG